LMKPYPRRQLTNAKRIYNYRISRGRKSIECAFGMLVSKFRLLETAICYSVERTDVVIQAVCVLHNFIRIREGVLFNPTRPLFAETTVTSSSTMEQGSHRRPSISALDLRNRLCQYFLQPHGVLPW
jgi:hypothetical protein